MGRQKRNRPLNWGIERKTLCIWFCLRKGMRNCVRSSKRMIKRIERYVETEVNLYDVLIKEGEKLIELQEEIEYMSIGFLGTSFQKAQPVPYKLTVALSEKLLNESRTLTSRYIPPSERKKIKCPLPIKLILLRQARRTKARLRTIQAAADMSSREILKETIHFEEASDYGSDVDHDQGPDADHDQGPI